MFDAVAELVRAAARERALFVALEDVHAADRSSLLLLGHLVAGGARTRALLVVLTYRAARGRRRRIRSARRSRRWSATAA